MNLYGEMDQALTGQLYGLVEDTVIETGIAKEDINFGSPVFGHEGEENDVYGAHLDQSELTLDADLVTSNVITLTIQGETVAHTFATDHATSMTALIAKINADAELAALGITASAGSTNRKIIIRGKGLDISASGAVTLGASQAGITAATSTFAKFVGIAMSTAKSSNLSNARKYEAGDAINIVAKGKVWVTVAVAVSDKQSAYAIIASTNRNTFSNSSSSTYDVGGIFRSNRVVGGTDVGNIAILEVRGLK